MPLSGQCLLSLLYCRADKMTQKVMELATKSDDQNSLSLDPLGTKRKATPSLQVFSSDTQAHTVGGIL